MRGCSTTVVIIRHVHVHVCAGESSWVLLTDIIMNGKDELSVDEFAESIRVIAEFVRRHASDQRTHKVEDVIGV